MYRKRVAKYPLEVLERLRKAGVDTSRSEYATRLEQAVQARRRLQSAEQRVQDEREQRKQTVRQEFERAVADGASAADFLALRGYAEGSRLRQHQLAQQAAGEKRNTEASEKQAGAAHQKLVHAQTECRVIEKHREAFDLQERRKAETLQDDDAQDIQASRQSS